MPAPRGNWLDRAILAVAPKAGLSRIRARTVAETIRHYEAAQGGRRTQNWSRRHSDANIANGAALATLRALARDSVRNNPWADEILRLISEHTVGDSGIVGKASGPGAEGFQQAWNRWAETTDCDADGQCNLAGLQDLVMRTVAESGECLVRRRWREKRDGLALPFQIQVLEPDYLDTAKDGEKGVQGGPIIQGVEFDAIGRRVAYWLFPEHPGSNRAPSASRRVSADDVTHVYRVKRPGQVRGVSWFAPVLARLRDYDEFEDAQILKQKISACLSVFVTDVEGNNTALGATDEANPLIETLEPGMVVQLPPGRQVQTANPPAVTDDGFSMRTLRSVAAGTGVTYEDMVGDYANVNYSSGRMGRQKHWSHVRSWQYKMMVPQFCEPVWEWGVEAGRAAGIVVGETGPTAKWTAPPPDSLEPEKEGRAAQMMVRAGLRTPSEVIREQGYDPETFFKEYADDLAKLDQFGIHLDSDVRRVSQAGLTQARPGATGFNDEAKDAAELAEEIAEASATEEKEEAPPVEE